MLKMVYFLTSANVKNVKILLTDYEKTVNLSPHEYLKAYLDNSSDDKNSKKVRWLIETFLGILKHEHLLLGLLSAVSTELYEDDQDFFVILCYSVMFDLNPKYEDLLYKCMFNLSKKLLKIFSSYFGQENILNTVWKVATVNFDVEYVTQKIIESLKAWQPVMIKMSETYEKYIKKIEDSRLIPLTIPVEPNVLRHKRTDPVKLLFPTSSNTEILPRFFPSTKKMLTKDKIDKKLKDCQKNNKQKAENLLNEIKTIKYHYAQDIPEKQQNEDEIKKLHTFSKPIKKYNHKAILNKTVEVKETALTLKRIQKRIQIEEDKEIQWIDGLLKRYTNSGNIEELEEQFRQKQKTERLADIEKKHLLGQLSYEDAIIAKQKLFDENKKKYEEFLKEKQLWNEKIEDWKKSEQDNNKKIIEKLSLIDLNVLEAKSSISFKNKESAEKVKQESEMLRRKALKRKNKELERRFKLIKELKLLALVAKQARVPKVIDLTESSGIGLFCEMSLAELQERLAAMKINIQEELNNKRKFIKEKNIATKEDLENTKKCIKEYLTEKTQLRKEHKQYKDVKNKNLVKLLQGDPSEEISELRKKLEEKQKFRKGMSN